MVRKSLILAALSAEYS